MIGLKDICALLAAGSMGAGSVVAVQQVKPKPVVTKAKPAPAKARVAKARPASPRPAPSTGTTILDCPTPGLTGSPWSAEPTSALEDAPTWERFIRTGGDGPGWAEPVGVILLPPPSIPEVPTDPGAIPEPGAWAMVIAGFGVVGAMFRRERIEA